jgi:hypothetical protein
VGLNYCGNDKAIFVLITIPAHVGHCMVILTTTQLEIGYFLIGLYSRWFYRAHDACMQGALQGRPFQHLFNVHALNDRVQVQKF